MVVRGRQGPHGRHLAPTTRLIRTPTLYRLSSDPIQSIHSPSVYLSYHPYISLSVRLSVRLLVCLSTLSSARHCLLFRSHGPFIHSFPVFVRLSFCPCDLSSVLYFATQSFCPMVNPFVRLIIHRSIPLSLCLLVCPLFRQLVRLSFRSSVGLFPRPSASLSAIIPFVHPFLCGRSRPWVSGTSRVFDSKQYDEEELIESTVAENRLCSNSALLMESFQMSLHSLSIICACVRVW